MTGAPAAADPRISIELPGGHPAQGGALQWVMAAATPATGFVEAEVLVDGVGVPRTVRRQHEQAAISAWCDTRGLLPGLHEIVVHGRWAGGGRATASRLLVVALGEPAERHHSVAGDPAAVGVAEVGDPDLDEALARTALGGPPLVLLDEHCVPGPGALRRIASEFADPAGVDVVIGDEAAMIAPARWMRWRKRAFQPEALPSVDQVGPLLAVGPHAADVLCDALPAAAGLYGLALELLDRGLLTAAPAHVLALTPEVRMPVDRPAGRMAIERLAARRGRPVAIAEHPLVGGLRDVRWPLVAQPDVVAVIASRTPALADRCLTGIAERTTYAALRAIVVDSSEDEGEMRRVVDAAPIATTCVRYPAGERFNYQRAANLGARHAGQANVLFLNDDVRPLTADWLTRMVELATLPGVGIVGALLRHPDGRIQHAGVQISEGSGHLYHDAPADARGHRFELLVPGNPEAVTGACMLARRELLEQLGGHDERYLQVYGDVDLCFRAAAHGWRIAWCHAAELEHLESASYGGAVEEADIRRFHDQWHRDRDRSPSTRVRA